MDFMQRATEAVHPRNKVISLPKDLKIIINRNREVYIYNIFNHRIKFVKYWADRAQQLRNENKKLLQRAPEPSWPSQGEAVGIMSDHGGSL